MSWNIAAFREAFDQFADPDKWPDAKLQGLYDRATCFVYPRGWRLLNGKCQRLALNLMVAHMGTLTEQRQNAAACGAGGTVGAVTGATVSGVTVSLQPPPVKNGWQQWLSLTPWGLELWAMLSQRSAGGFYVGGRPELAGFRRGGGFF